MNIIKTSLLCGALVAATSAARAEPNVVASIKPVHSLVSAVMRGVGQPGLIVGGAASPHDFALKPSQARMLEKADLVFWIGPRIETFLSKPIKTIAADATAVMLLESRGVKTLDLREGGAFDAHDHAAHGHDDHGHDDHGHDDHGHDDHGHDDHGHDDHGHDDHGHDDHGHDEHGHDEHGHDDHGHDDHGHDDHARGEIDSHVWLDPVNAKAMVHEIEEALVTADPANKVVYIENARRVTERLDALVKETSERLAPVRNKGFVVFHDAYRYFENRFGVTAVGSITVSPEVPPGAERIGEIREKIEKTGAVCVFAEPQFTPKLVAVVTEGTDAKSGVIDPLGATLNDGPELYFTLIRDMAESIRDCLSETS